MIPNWDKILKEWSYRVGVIKPNDGRHLYHLNKILEERYRNFSDYYLIYGQELITSLKESLKPLQQAFTILEL